jgi:hypothetical protein
MNRPRVSALGKPDVEPTRPTDRVCPESGIGLARVRVQPQRRQHTNPLKTAAQVSIQAHELISLAR